MKTLLITGTDTDVGKSVLTTSLVAYWQTYLSHKSLGLMKLMQTGIGDRELYHQLFVPSASLEIVVPLSFITPVAPPIASQIEGIPIDLGKIWQALTTLQKHHDFILVEALGGLGSPVTEELTVADLARDWNLPIVLVVGVKLGAIAQVVANVALARQCKLKIQGIVLSCVQHCTEEELLVWTPINLIQSLTQVPVLGVLPHLNDPTNLTQLTQVAANLNLAAFYL
jgi:dethiobiotin synthetase